MCNITHEANPGIRFLFKQIKVRRARPRPPARPAAVRYSGERTAVGVGWTVPWSFA
jgi:hypothetical protein